MCNEAETALPVLGAIVIQVMPSSNKNNVKSKLGLYKKGEKGGGGRWRKRRKKTKEKIEVNINTKCEQLKRIQIYGGSSWRYPIFQQTYIKLATSVGLNITEKIFLL